MKTLAVHTCYKGKGELRQAYYKIPDPLNPGCYIEFSKKLFTLAQCKKHMSERSKMKITLVEM